MRKITLRAIRSKRVKKKKHRFIVKFTEQQRQSTNNLRKKEIKKLKQ